MPFETAIANRLGNRASNQDRGELFRRADAVLAVLADGMGGHARGELAAQLAVETLGRLFHRQETALSDPERFLSAAVLQAHRAVIQGGLEQQPPVYPRTTLVACVARQDRAWWVHVGDSRLYLVRNGGMIARTRDHTYVEELRRTGAISETEARKHPMRNYVTHCLGGQRKKPRVSADSAGPLVCGDVLLLCSDGFWEPLNEARIAAALSAGGVLDDTITRLAADAEQAAYPNSDNISAVAVRLCPDVEVDTGPSAGATVQQGEASHAEPVDLSQAIDNIERAIQEYKDELDEEQ